jgi:hypothetical protein
VRVSNLDTPIKNQINFLIIKNRKKSPKKKTKTTDLLLLLLTGSGKWDRVVTAVDKPLEFGSVERH